MHAESIIHPKSLLLLLDLEELWEREQLIQCHLRSLKHVKLTGNDHCPGEYHCSTQVNQELRQRAKTLTSRHLSSFGEGGGEGPEEGRGLPRLPGDALHIELQDLQAP